MGTFANQGQICLATSRHLMHESIAEEYTHIVAGKPDELPVGDPCRDQMALGPLIDAGQRDRVHGLVTASVEGGATVHTGGRYEGLFYPPTLLGNVPVYQGEIFGPVRAGDLVLLPRRGRGAGRRYGLGAVRSAS